MTENRIDTSCGTCIFAKYNDEKTQNGCRAGIIDKIKEKNKITLSYDNGTTYFIIEDFVCNFWRPIAWKSAKGIDEPIDALLEFARAESTLKCDIVIYCYKTNTFEELKRTLDSIKSMSLKPYNIILLNDGMSTLPEFLTWVDKQLQGMRFRTEFIIEQQPNILKALDIGIEKSKSSFVATFSAGFSIPTDFLKLIDKAIYDDLERFVLLKSISPTNINGMVVMRKLFTTLSGNKYRPLLEITEALCKEQKCLHMIRPVAEIVPAMSESV
jgi:hypothetical protein